MNTRLKPLVVLFINSLLLGMATLPVFAQGNPLNRPALPALRVTPGVRGEAAITALGDQMAAVAAHYGKSTNELRAIFRRDHSLRLDERGNLYYTCDGLSVADGAVANTNEAPLVAQIAPLSQTFLLHSKPGSSKVIYLDFDGYTNVANAWTDTKNGGASIVAPPWDIDGNPASFGTNEQTIIQQIWYRVAEDYAGFDVDVTTEYPGEAAITRSSTGDTQYGTRALVSAISSYFGAIGGIAYVGVYDNVGDYYKPALIFPERLGNSEKNIAEAISHEVGHNLGLSHDGTTTGDAYYAGQGNWAPIMGVGYYKPITQWSKGEYANANNTEDDLAIINSHGLSYRTDEFGSTLGAATFVPRPSNSLSTNGIISRNTDVDYVAFLATAGTAQVLVTNWERGANLHLVAALYNSAGVLVTNVESVDDSSGTRAINFSGLVSNGTNYIAIDGLGSGDPVTTGYSDYASLGQYTLTLTLPASGAWLPTLTGSYSWTNATNWFSGNVPNALDTTANLTTLITGDQFITLDSPLTIGQLLLGNPATTNAYFLQSGIGGALTFDVVSGTAALLKYGSGADEISANLALADSLVISNGPATNLKISGAIIGAGGLTKMGAGRLLLSATNTFAGNLVVSNGTLALAPDALLASPLLDLRSGTVLEFPGGYTFIGGQTLAGRGAITGQVVFASGATLAPGNTNAAGTLTFSNSLTLGGANWNVDLAATTGTGGDTNDFVAITGDLTLTDTNLITVNARESSLVSPGVYTIANYGGTLTGSAANLLVTNNTRLLITADTSTPGEVRLIVSGASANLVWRGDNVGNIWNVAGKTNWLNGAANDQFFQFDTVTFDDTGTNNTPVSLSATLRPSALTVNAAKNFIFNGSGKISGPVAFSKMGSGLLTISNANDFSGGVTISGGTLKMANSNALGTTASATFVTNTGTLDLNGFNLGTKPLVISGQGTGGGAIVNSGGTQTNALKNVTFTGNVLVSATNRWDIRDGSLAGNGFSLAKSGASDVWLVGLGSTGLGDLEVRQGILGIQGTTTLGIASNSLALWNGATLSLADNAANVLSKNIVATNALITSGSGSNVLGGTLTANGTLGLAVTTQLELRSALAGSGTITKSGVGNLFLTGTNLCIGTLNLDSSSTTSSEGWVRVTNSKALQNFASPIFIRANNSGFSTLQLDASITVTQAIQLSGRNTNVAAIQNLGGSNTLAGGFILQTGGGNFWLQSDAGTLVLDGEVPISLPNTSGRALTFLGAGNHLVKGTLQDGTGGGSVGIIKTNTGTLTLSGTNTFSRFTLLSQGVIDVFSSRAFGAGVITNDTGTNTGRIVLEGGVTVTNAIVATTVNPGASLGLLMVNGNVSATLSGPIAFNSNAVAGGHIVGPTTGAPLLFSGPITMPAGVPLIIRSGNVRFSGGGNYTEIQPRSQTTSLGATNGIPINAVVELGGNGTTTTPTALDLNGFNQTLAGLKNVVTSNNAAWVTNGLATTNTLTLALGASNFVYGGSVVGRVALTLNSGTQVFTKFGTSTLNGLYTYSGATVINGGALVLAAGMTLPNTPVIALGGGMLDVTASGFTLATAQALQGNGTVLGNFTANGTVAPGFGVGTLVASNNVTLNAVSKTLMEISKSPTTNDLLQVAGTLTYGGTLTVSNLAGALAPGDTFKLFSAATYTGSFAATNLPTLPLGQGWKFTGTNGTLTLLQLIATNSTNLNFIISSNALQLTWPVDHLGWTLQAQTNALDAGLSTNWVSLAGTANTNSFLAPLTTTNGAVFYRLKFP